MTTKERLAVARNVVGAVMGVNLTAILTAFNVTMALFGVSTVQDDAPGVFKFLTKVSVLFPWWVWALISVGLSAWLAYRTYVVFSALSEHRQSHDRVKAIGAAVEQNLAEMKTAFAAHERHIDRAFSKADIDSKNVRAAIFLGVLARPQVVEQLDLSRERLAAAKRDVKAMRETAHRDQQENDPLANLVRQVITGTPPTIPARGPVHDPHNLTITDEGVINYYENQTAKYEFYLIEIDKRLVDLSRVKGLWFA